MHHITFSATNGDTTEPERITRLARVYEAAHRLVCDKNANPHAGLKFASELVRMHDHKGDLTVLWSCSDCARSVGSIEAINEAWQTEGENNVNHVSLNHGCVFASTGEDGSLAFEDDVWKSWISPVEHAALFLTETIQ
jgi:hypothetical protein